MKIILLIDDETYAINNLARILERKKYKVFTADSGEKGLEIYKEQKPDIVFLDILMPGINGEDTLKYILEIDRDAKVYFVTGYENIISLDKALKLGAKGLINKPLYIENILKLIDSV